MIKTLAVLLRPAGIAVTVAALPTRRGLTRPADWAYPRQARTWAAV